MKMKVESHTVAKHIHIQRNLQVYGWLDVVVISETIIVGGTDVPSVYTKLPLGVVKVTDKLPAASLQGHNAAAAAEALQIIL